MPHWNERGEETVVCQKGSHTVPASQVEWRPDITGNQSAGNVCKACIRSWHMNDEDWHPGREAELRRLHEDQ